VLPRHTPPREAASRRLAAHGVYTGGWGELGGQVLVEIADDLYDYEEDVAAATFNVYRMFLHLYGGQVCA
jgi:hypothetical protein